MPHTTPNKKTILITGASSGMGQAGAAALLREGHVVYGAARRVDKMQEIVDAGGFALPLDITDRSSIAETAEQVIDEQGRIDILWNNAGYSVSGAVEDVSYEDATRQFEVNLFGLAEMTKAVLPQMRKQRSGIILNTSSAGGKVYTPLGAWYHATKHALEGWSDCLRLELGQHGIHVVILQPGGIQTEFGDVMIEPLLERSKGGAYEELAQGVGDFYRDAYSNGRNSPPSAIGDAVVRIISARKPKTRYAVGYGAKPILFLRKRLSDRLFDRLIMSTFRIKSR